MILLWSIEHMEFKPVWTGHSIKPMDKNKHKRRRFKMSSLDDWQVFSPYPNRFKELKTVTAEAID